MLWLQIQGPGRQPEGRVSQKEGPIKVDSGERWGQVDDTRWWCTVLL